MKKQEFLDRIAERLSDLPRKEVLDRLAFYSEMIDDRMEEGLPQEEAVAAIGSVDSVVAQIVADIPLVKIAREKMKRRKRLRVWENVLLWVGSPIWGSLLIAAFAIVLSLYATLWAVVISLWASFGALIGSGIGGTVAGICFAVTANAPTGFAVIGAGLVCLGISVFCFYACRPLTTAAVRLPKRLAIGIKSCLMKKEDKP